MDRIGWDGEARGEATHGKTRLLIVDDRPQSRDGLKALLATCPEVVIVGEAAEGGEAVHLVQECSPDVVLLDVRMPGMDGLEATRVIKHRWPLVRVVVLTIYASCRADALAGGADAFLVKGCPTEELLSAISPLRGRPSPS